MRLDAHTQLFFDASCLIAAAGSPTGGSGFLLSLCGREFLSGVVSQVVLLEAEHNIRAKLDAQTLADYHELLQAIPLTLAPVPLIDDKEAWVQQVNPKDLHLLAATLAIEAEFLVSLDLRLIAEVKQTNMPVQAMTPGDFICRVLPTHRDYPRIR